MSPRDFDEKVQLKDYSAKKRNGEQASSDEGDDFLSDEVDERRSFTPVLVDHTKSVQAPG